MTLQIVGALLCVCMVCKGAASAQSGQGSITGIVADPSGAVIRQAQITATASDGKVTTTASDARGRYVLPNLAPGDYRVEVVVEGFEPSAESVQVPSSGSVVHNVNLVIATVQQKVVVATTSSTLDTDPSNNASALALTGSALESLSDDPDDLAQDLQALAGPSVGPDGGEIYVDGFAGAKIPPKSAIREVRVNQNPFSAEYDRVGFGRVEILTKPGTGKLHLESIFSISDARLNSRNPFATEKPDYQRRMMEVTLGGPLSKKASFTVEVERRDIGQTAIINGLILDDALNIVPYKNVITDPRTNTEVNGRIDYQLSPNHTLVGRYEWERDTQQNAGLTNFSLPSTAYNNSGVDHDFRLTETAILSPRAINEVRFQFDHSNETNLGLTSDPTLLIPDGLLSGGSAVGLSKVTENRYQLQELLSLSRARHTLKLGGRLRIVSRNDRSMENYNGIFTFASMEAYRITESGLRDGLTPGQIRDAGGGASQFSIVMGNPVASLTQSDVGLFVQDDWRIRNNVTLSAGLRFEKQTNISDWGSLAPRIGLAYAPSGVNGKPIVVLRAGFGYFYDRVGDNLVLDARRLDGVRRQQFVVRNPDFYPNVPSRADLSAYPEAEAIRVLGHGLRAPYMQQLAFTLERELPKNVTASLTYSSTRGLHALRSRNINAPLPGSYDPLDPGTGIRPLPGGDIYAYESNGFFRQNQLIANLNARINKRYSLFGYYTWSRANSNTDGAGSFPADPYNWSIDYGRAGYDARHRLFLAGNVGVPYGFSLNPFLVIHSGEPFNITTGEDLNGDSIFNDRPTWATDLTRPSVVETRWGTFDTRPMPGQTIIPRNLGTAPGVIGVNLRISKSFGFGEREASETQAGGDFAGPRGGPGPGGAGRGPGGGPGDHGHDGDSGRKYTLTFSVTARNLLNHVNPEAPVGNLSSPLFGHSVSIHTPPGQGASGNRMIQIQARFSF